MTFEYHDNEVDFCLWFNDSDPGYRLKSGSYVIHSNNDYIVTSGQDPDDEMHKNGQMNQALTISEGGTTGTLIYRLGRKNSDAVNNWINGRVKPECQNIGYSMGDKIYGNFAFVGTLTLELTGGRLLGSSETFIFKNFLLGQTHDTGTTNQWIYGNNDYCQYVGKLKVTTRLNDIPGVKGSLASFSVGAPDGFSSSASYHFNINSISFSTPSPIG
ncbi:hypothetical protein MF265_21460 [Serratia marcescens]|uniref:hypothetical protein n=1 Tax=Serratia marcescens TaxID=615 RepID=UPI001EEFE122|nr:hypothetical protein [Serratia marcescens]ULH10471.1 hypothetical protein MF265_21460 [Serratia marcescens]